jgi:hypothetical protein
MHVCTRYMAHCDWRFVVVLRQSDDVQLPREPSTGRLVVRRIDGG